jgi:hypothetical protein
MAIDPSQAQAIFDQLREIDRRSTRVEVQTETLLRAVGELAGKLDARERPCEPFKAHIMEHADAAKSKRTIFNTVAGGLVLSILGAIAAGLVFAIRAGWMK